RGAQASDGVLLLKVIDRQPGQEAEFGSSQENLRRMLQQELLSEARTQLVATLANQATFWPRDLFMAGAPAASSNGAAPAAAASAGAAPAGAPESPSVAKPPGSP